MKKLMFLSSVIIFSSFASETPISSPQQSAKRQLFVSDSESETEPNIQYATPTSPAKPVFLSPEKSTSRGKRSRVAGADEGHSTERLSEAERRMEKVPSIMYIKNEFNYPIMIMYPSFPRTTTKALFPGEQENLKGLKLTRPDTIMISANNRIHMFEYNGTKFLHHINKTVTGDIELGFSKAAIVIDSLGDIHLKAVSE